MRRAARTALSAFVASRVESGWIVCMGGSCACSPTPWRISCLQRSSWPPSTWGPRPRRPTCAAPGGRRRAGANTCAGASAARSSLQSALHAVHRQESVFTSDGIVLPAGAEDAVFKADGLQAVLCAHGDCNACARMLLRLDAEESRSRRIPGRRADPPGRTLGWPRRGVCTVRRGIGRLLHLRPLLRAPGGHARPLRRARRGVGGRPPRRCFRSGLVPSAPALRPADILTSAALLGRLAALDIGVTCQEATGAGEDCCDAMYRRKRLAYAQHLRELEEAQDVAYRPMVWSAFGRAHPEAEAMLTSMAILAARCRGLCDHRLILRRARCAIGVALVRRAVQMVHACFLHLDT